MSDLMQKIAKKSLYQVTGVYHFEGEVKGQDIALYAATSKRDAVEQAQKFWQEEMKYDSFTGIATLIDNIGGYKVVLVEDEQA